MAFLAGVIVGGLIVMTIGAALVDEAARNGDYDICGCRWQG